MFTKLNKLFFPYGNNETFWEIEPTKKAAIQETLTQLKIFYHHVYLSSVNTSRT